jgi:ABC-2 type transport system permease protein
VNAHPAKQPTTNLWVAVWKLLRLRILIFLSGFRHATLRRKIGILVLAVVVTAFAGFIFYLSWLLLQFLQSPTVQTYFEDFQPLLASIPNIILMGAFLGILLTSFGVLLQALYLAGDMDFLLSVPVPIRAVFTSKLLQAILPNLAFICLFALPVLFGIGLSYDYSWIYYPMVLITLGALALAAAGLSSLLVMIVVRVFPARRVAEILGFLGAIFSFLCSQSGQFARFGDVTQDQATQALNMATRFDVAWSPLSWAGRGLAALGAGEWIGLLSVLPTLVLAGLIFAFALITSERLYYTGWSSIKSKSRKVKTRRRARSERRNIVQALLESKLPGGLRAIVLKDWLVMRRDLRNMSQLITPLIFGIIYAIMFFRDGGPSIPIESESDAPLWLQALMVNISVYFNVGISLFVGWMLLARLAGMAFSQEGQQYWLLKSAPVSTAVLVASKFAVAYLPTLALGWGFLLIISLVQRTNLFQLLFTIPVVALCIAGNAGLNLTFGITGANFDWEDPRKMQRGAQGCLSALATMAYLPISLTLFFGPAILLTAFGLPEAVGQVVGLIVGGVFSLACGFIPLYLASKRVPRLAEA